MEFSQKFEASPNAVEAPFEPNFDRIGANHDRAGYAQEAQVLDQSKALPELTLAMGDGKQALEAEQTKQVAEAGSTVYAGGGTEVFAKAGSTVYAEMNSIVHADKGATIHARNGSRIIANDGTSVNSNEGPTIHQDKGAVIEVPYQAKVSAYKDAVVSTKFGEVFAYDGSTVYANCEYSDGSPSYPPTIHAKGKCNIYAVKGATIDAEDGSTPVIKGWDGSTRYEAK